MCLNSQGQNWYDVSAAIWWIRSQYVGRQWPIFPIFPGLHFHILISHMSSHKRPVKYLLLCCIKREYKTRNYRREIDVVNSSCTVLNRWLVRLAVRGGVRRVVFLEFLCCRLDTRVDGHIEARIFMEGRTNICTSSCRISRIIGN